MAPPIPEERERDQQPGARVSRVPARVVAKVVDGDLRMWLPVVPGETVVVLDYRGARVRGASRDGALSCCGLGLLLLGFRTAEQRQPSSAGRDPADARDGDDDGVSESLV